MNNWKIFRSLKNNPVFARLYAAQTVSLFGDAFTWVGLALLAFELAGKKSPMVLATALTLRVAAFVIFAPLAGAIADRWERKRIMVITHMIRTLIVGSLPFVMQIWQVYLLIFGLNIVNAFFTPTYQATIPLVTGKNDYPHAIALSSATYQFFGVIGPGIAGSIAALIGARLIFLIDALTFILAAVLILTLPGQLRVNSTLDHPRSDRQTWSQIHNGTIRLFVDQHIRYALFLQLVASIAGAQILVNTVSYVQGSLKLGKVEYGWIMAAFGIGATIIAAIIPEIKPRYRPRVILSGTMLMTLALLPANYANYLGLMGLWLLAGVGQNSVNLPTQTLIADRIPTEAQGRVYGAHFAWSHLWWLFSYPLAGWLGSNFHGQEFFYTSLIGLCLLMIVQITLVPATELSQQSKNG